MGGDFAKWLLRVQKVFAAAASSRVYYPFGYVHGWSLEADFDEFNAL